jgi:hypothetical protein
MSRRLKGLEAGGTTEAVDPQAEISNRILESQRLSTRLQGLEAGGTTETVEPH